MSRIALLANPDSGSGEAEAVERALSGHGAEVRRFAIDDAEQALEAGPDRIVVAGGDGSIGCAADLASRSGVPLAVVAVGTANDFARVHELPDQLDDACELAARGERTRSLELGRIDGRAFVNVVSLGLSPAAARRASELKARLGPLAYAVGAIRAGFSAQPTWCRVVADEGEQLFTGQAWQATVACSGAFGGGAQVEADPTDGMLDAVVVESGSRLRLIARAHGMRSGRLEQQGGVHKRRTRTVELELKPDTSLNVDGELITRSGIVRLTAEHDAVDLIVG